MGRNGTIGFGAGEPGSCSGLWPPLDAHVSPLLGISFAQTKLSEEALALITLPR